MAGFKLHIFFAFVVMAGLTFALYHFFNILPFKPIDLIFIIPITLIYGILPDLDTTSKVRKYFLFLFSISFILILLWIFYLVRVGSPLKQVYLACIFGVIEALLGIFILSSKHRGFIHTIWAGLFFAMPIFLISHNYVYFLVGTISYFSHLILDGKFF
jgi:hypothetical protein